MLTILTAAEAPQEFETWYASVDLTAIESHPMYGAYGRTYYQAVFDAEKTDTSFAVLIDGAPLLLVPCSVGGGTLDYWGSPILIFPRAGLSAEVEAAAISHASDQFERVAQQYAVNRTIILDNSSNGTLSPIGEQCLNRKFLPETTLTALCDLTEGEISMRRGLRKSYKSLLNWGKRNLSLGYVGLENPDRALFLRFQEFHRTVAGRTTRPQSSWDASFDWIVSGHGELVLGFLPNDELVAGTMVYDGGERTLYGTGVYDRERFDKPMAHWCLWVAMLRAAERGKKTFELGQLPFSGRASDKEVSIGYFKRGFSTSIATSIVWTLQTQA